MSSDFAFEVTEAGDVHVVSLHGQLDLASAGPVRDALVRIAGSTVVVDLSDLRFLDSSGIAALLSARSQIMQRGHGFQLRGAHGIVRRVLEVTGLAFLLADPVEPADYGDHADQTDQTDQTEQTEPVD